MNLASWSIWGNSGANLAHIFFSRIWPWESAGRMTSVQPWLMAWNRCQAEMREGQPELLRSSYDRIVLNCAEYRGNYFGSRQVLPSLGRKGLYWQSQEGSTPASINHHVHSEEDSRGVQWRQLRQMPLPMESEDSALLEIHQIYLGLSVSSLPMQN